MLVSLKINEIIGRETKASKDNDSQDDTASKRFQMIPPSRRCICMRNVKNATEKDLQSSIFMLSSEKRMQSQHTRSTQHSVISEGLTSLDTCTDNTYR